MKRIVAIILFLMLVSICAYGESMDDIMPNPALWGVSRDALKEKLKTNFKTCEVGKKKALTSSSVNIEGYTMLPYYVFGVKTWDSTGYQFMGLSKVVYILSDNRIASASQRDACKQSLIDSLSERIGQPHSQSDAVARWKLNDCFVEVGKGKFKNYTGSKDPTVAIAFSAIEITNPVTPSPTPRATPMPAPKVGSLPSNDTIASGVRYITSVANQHDFTVEAVYCLDVGNGIYQFTAGIDHSAFSGIGKKIRFTKDSKGMIRVIETENTHYLYTNNEKIPGTIVWGDKNHNSDANALREVIQAFSSLDELDANGNGELEFDELFHQAN